MAVAAHQAHPHHPTASSIVEAVIADVAGSAPGRPRRLEVLAHEDRVVEQRQFPLLLGSSRVAQVIIKHKRVANKKISG